MVMYLVIWMVIRPWEDRENVVVQMQMDENSDVELLNVVHVVHPLLL